MSDVVIAGANGGFAQSAVIPLWLEHERLKARVEMQYRNLTDKDMRGGPIHTFVIGPTMAWKPTSNTRFDLSPLFGCTEDSPRLQGLRRLFDVVWTGRTRNKRRSACFYTESLDFLIASKTLF